LQACQYQALCFFIVVCIIVFVYLDASSTSFIIRFVFNIFIGQCTCGDFIFVFFSFTRDNTAFKVGVFTYVNIKAFFACINATLVSNALIIAVNLANACAAANGFITAKPNACAS
jgi:hypothetical protein